jgi:hypothetical protein
VTVFVTVAATAVVMVEVVVAVVRDSRVVAEKVMVTVAIVVWSGLLSAGIMQEQAELMLGGGVGAREPERARGRCASRAQKVEGS